jgi:hypothetical protein
VRQTGKRAQRSDLILTEADGPSWEQQLLQVRQLLHNLGQRSAMDPAF